MVNFVDLDYSANANSGMRQVRCFLLHILVNLKTIRRGAHLTDCFWGSRGALKYPQGPTRNDFDAKMVNIADLDYSVDANYGIRQEQYFFFHTF